MLLYLFRNRLDIDSSTPYNERTLHFVQFLPLLSPSRPPLLRPPFNGQISTSPSFQSLPSSPPLPPFTHQIIPLKVYRSQNQVPPPRHVQRLPAWAAGEVEGEEDVGQAGLSSREGEPLLSEKRGKNARPCNEQRQYLPQPQAKKEAVASFLRGGGAGGRGGGRGRRARGWEGEEGSGGSGRGDGCGCFHVVFPFLSLFFPRWWWWCACHDPTSACVCGCVGLNECGWLNENGAPKVLVS